MGPCVTPALVSVVAMALRPLLVAALLALTAPLGASAKGAFEGTDANFDGAVLNSGKNVFV